MTSADGHLGRAGDRLGHLIVVDEHEAGFDGLENVGLGEDSGQAAVVGQDHEGRSGGGGDLPAHIGEAGIGVEGNEFAVDEALDACGVPDDPGGRRRVVGADDQADAVRPGEFDDLVVQWQVAR